MLAALGVAVLVLILVGAWLRSGRTAPLPVASPDPQVVDLFRARVQTLTAEVDGWDASGEAKRHRVYAQLIKEFPGKSKREIAFVIEDVLFHG